MLSSHCIIIIKNVFLFRIILLFCFFTTAITCLPLRSVTNGVIRYSPDSMEPFDFGTAAMYSCATGFFLEGGRMRTCGGNEISIVGTWNGIAPVCTGEMFKI